MKKNVLLVLLLLFGFWIVFFNEKVVQQIDNILAPKDTRETIATIQSLDGKVRYKTAKSLKYKNASDKLELKNQDVLTTDENSHTKIAFASGFEIQVEPNSLIVIENPKKDEQGRIQITFLKGDFKVTKTGAPNQVIVSKDKKFQDLAGRSPLKTLQIDLTPQALIPDVVEQTELKVPKMEKETLEEKKKVLVEKEKKPEKVKKARETLSDEYISQVVNSQKPFFNRCYAQHLRLNPDSRGQIHLAFTINVQGKVATVSLIQSTLSDPQLEKCTMSVIERCRFKAFDGDPIVVNYPINFE
jgi:TonB family protein